MPNASCILFGKEPPCPACDSAHNQPNSKDKRRQTSLLLKLYHADGSFKTILIDAGWTLSASVMDLFPKHGISKIDAVFITHEHADAINGLPFLRSWTLHGFQSSIDVYTSSHTFEFLRKSFPYLVARLQGGRAYTPRLPLVDEKLTIEVQLRQRHLIITNWTSTTLLPASMIP